MEKKPSVLSSVLRIAQPLLLIGGLLTYTLGLGLLHFLGIQINWGTALLGGSLTLLILLTRNFLSVFFTFPEDLPSASLSHEIKGEDPDFIHLNDIQQNLLLQIALVALGVGAAVTFVLMVKHSMNWITLIALGIALLLVFLSSVPPVRAERKGYGELIEAVLICNLFPAIAFFLQEPTLHPFLGILTFPLTFVYLSMKLATSLEYYFHAVKFKTGSMLAQMGWQRAISVHNLSILLAFLLLGGFVFLRLPWVLAWSIFLALPLGILQIILVQRIADGAPPRWWFVRLSALSTFTVMTYLTILTLWMH